jgi:hypothetical protein
MDSSRMPPSKEILGGDDRLGCYEWIKGFEKIRNYYLEHGRYACAHAQERHGLIALM